MDWRGHGVAKSQTRLSLSLFHLGRGVGWDGQLGERDRGKSTLPQQGWAPRPDGTRDVVVQLGSRCEAVPVKWLHQGL